MTSPTPEAPRSRTIVILRSLVSWDLMVALVIGAIVYSIWLTRSDDPQWSWLASSATASVALVAVAVKLRDGLRHKLSATAYGELLRITDRTEFEARLPYSSVLIVAWSSALVSASLAMLIEIVNDRTLQASMLAGAAFVVSWALFGVLQLSITTGQHDGLVAGIEALQEEVDAEQRRHVEANYGNHAESEGP